MQGSGGEGAQGVALAAWTAKKDNSYGDWINKVTVSLQGSEFLKQNTDAV